MPAGRKPKPPGTTVTRHERKHDWAHATDTGWQHGDVPEPPDGLLSASVEAWDLWFGSWWAAFWTPADLPQLRTAIVTYDRVMRGDERVTSLGILDKLGITPKGRQDLRWAAPKDNPAAQADHAAELSDLDRKRAERRKRLA